MEHIFESFWKMVDSPFFPNWSSRTHKNPEQINQIAFKILEEALKQIISQKS